MEKVSIQQIFCKLCYLLPFVLVLVLVLFSLLYFFSVFESFPLSLFTTLVALFTTLFLVTLTRTKWSIDEKNLIQDVTKESEINADEKYEEQHDDQDSESQSTSSFENDQERSENYGMISNSDVEEEEEEEDSLIEIKLPNRYLVEEPNQKFESNLTELFLPEYMFKQKGLMDLLEEINEINEDENLIEIDISMGSTKCQDFRVKKELAYYGADQCVLSD
ncbi:uncharacterized protein LOC107496113 [Arachis duranensis]|uniref:Uncharacterized protein LOC107496113 n=1 Tax=Arachis duranensis TaxID=130453 RepID=A0A9C6T6F7_ARADU|nr:uncharacterized protein LOC107496113 [Arachis duranensis]